MMFSRNALGRAISLAIVVLTWIQGAMGRTVTPATLDSLDGEV